MNNRLMIWLLLIASVLVRLKLYHAHPPLWDASAYILMGKYLASYGSVGLIEPFRPLVWPMELGFFYSIGLDPIASGVALQTAMTLACIALVYLIGKEVYGSAVGLTAAIFLSLSPSWMFWGNCLYSEIPAAFAAVAAFYLFVRQRYFLAGMFGALSFFTKFTQLILIAVLLVGACKRAYDQKSVRPLVNFLFGLILMALPFLILQAVLYGDALYPFKEGRMIYGQFHEPFWQSVGEAAGRFLSVENFALILVPVGIWGALRPFDLNKALTVAAGVLSVAWIWKLAPSSVRYAILGLPFLYLLSAHGFVKILTWGKTHRMAFLTGLMFVCLVAVQIVRVAQVPFPPLQLDDFQRYVRNNVSRLDGGIWISSPRTLALFDLKADESLYYPVFDLAKAEHLRSHLTEAHAVFVDTRDIPCSPVNDPVCEEAKRDLIRAMQERLTAVEYVRYPDGIRAIFRKGQ
jgi:hypothetical protein